MKQRIIHFIVRKKQLILYLLFGAVTTVCSLLAWYVTLRLGTLVWHDENGDPTAWVDVLGSTTQWIVGVLVAFITNKRWVFIEAEHGWRASFRQLGVFSSSRVLTYFLEVFLNLGLIALLEALQFPNLFVPIFSIRLEITARFWAKVIAAIAIVITNYFISKLLVFRKKKDPKEKQNSAKL